MKQSQVLLLLGYGTGLALGQLLFKHAALKLNADRLLKPLLWATVTNGPLIAAIMLYAGLTALWVYILSFTELSKAYPFHALTLVLTPLMAQRVFGESLSTSYFVGLAAIIFGLLVIAYGDGGA